MPFVDSAGIPIYYEVVGDGFPLILQTGGGGDGSMWRDGGYLDGLTQFRCILLDHRGHGKSGKPREVTAHTVDRYAADALAVLDALQIERAAFWGYSAGAWTGFQLAAAAPDRIAAVIASGVIGEKDFDIPEEQEDAARFADEVRRRGLGPVIAEGVREEGFDCPDWFMAQMTSTDDEMFALQVLGSAQWHGPWSLLPQIQCPVLLLAGALEDPEDHNARAAVILPNGRSITFPALGHIGAYVRSDLALAEVMPFLEAITG
jgi:pimeloyl-ACP methyl ester carboxylesterase